MAKQRSPLWKLTCLTLALLVSACATPSAPPPAEPDRLPVLPTQGRVSLVAIPSECSPSCSKGLTRERNESVNLLTDSASLGKPASDMPIDYSLPVHRRTEKP